MIAPSELERYLVSLRAPEPGPLPHARLASPPRRHRRLGLFSRRGASAGADPRSAQAPIVIRPARDADTAAIARLSQLDGHDLPRGPRILAESRGRVLAAVEVASGAAVSDPFVPTAAAVDLVRLRAAQLRRLITQR